MLDGNPFDGYDDYVGSQEDGAYAQDEDNYYDPNGVTQTQNEQEEW